MLLNIEVDSGNQYRTTLPTLYPNTHVKGAANYLPSWWCKREYFKKSDLSHPKMIPPVREAMGIWDQASLLASFQKEWTLPFPDHPPFFMGTSSPLWHSPILGTPPWPWLFISPKCNQTCVTLLLSLKLTCPLCHAVTAWLDDGGICRRNLVSSSCSQIPEVTSGPMASFLSTVS